MKKGKILFFFVVIIVVLMAGCGNADREIKSPDINNTTQTDEGTTGNINQTNEVKTVGSGSKQFELSIVDLVGNETKYIVKTDKKTVGDALLELKIISGEDGPYGLYIKSVNGIRADYDKDKTYWSFLVNGEYAMQGVTQTDIEDGKKYSLKISK